MVHTRDGVDRDYWQAVLAETLRDPALRVYWWEPGLAAYVDSRGVEMAGEPDRSGPAAAPSWRSSRRPGGWPSSITTAR